MTWSPPSKVGDVDPSIVPAKSILEHGYSYARGVNDGTPFYTEKFGAVLVEYSRRVNDQVVKGMRQGPKIPTPGVLDWATKVQLGIIARAGSPTPSPVKMGNTHYLSAPGSGVSWFVGPPFDVGEVLKAERGVWHWPLGYPIGGYLGLMGGESSQSYMDTITLLDVELERRIREDVLPRYGLTVPAGVRVTGEQAGRLPRDFKLIVGGYSQSAEGVVRSADRLFGTGGVYQELAPRLAAVLAFGNPTRQGSGAPTTYGRSPKGGGISSYKSSAWLAARTIDVVTETPNAPDFYACCTSKIARMGYEVIVRAETELPFVVYMAKIVIPALLNIVAPFLGGIVGGAGGPLSSLLALPVLGSATGLGAAQLTPLLGMVTGGGEEPPAELIQMLTITGLLSSLPDLIGLLVALPGIGTHGEYHLPKPEFGGRTGTQVGIDLLRPMV